MRKVVLYTLMSLDGAVDNPERIFADGPEGFSAWDDEMELFLTESIATQDAVLLGRGTYDEWSSFWPSSQIQPFADFVNAVPKHVVTSTPLPEPAWTASDVLDGPLEEAVRALKDRPGADIGVHGSITLAQALLAADLVDELRLVVAPVWGCVGRRLFPGTGEPRRLRLVTSTTTSTGGLLLAYGR